MHQYYLSNLPIPFARGIAGFKDKPFHLRRNEVVPPISLQQKVFPFIERAYDSQGAAARQCWERECLEEMTTLNKVNDLENVDLVGEIEIIKKHWIRAGISDESVDSDTLWTPGIAKKSFLKLLIWLRRVILQDAVAYIHYGLSLFLQLGCTYAFLLLQGKVLPLQHGASHACFLQ